MWQLEDRSELALVARAIQEALFASPEFNSQLDAALTEKYKLPPSSEIIERAQRRQIRRISAASRARQDRGSPLEKLLLLMGKVETRIKEQLDEEKKR